MGILKTSLEANYDGRTGGQADKATYRGTSYHSAKKLTLAIIILSCILAAGKAMLKNFSCHLILQLGKKLKLWAILMIIPYYELRVKKYKTHFWMSYCLLQSCPEYTDPPVYYLN